MSHHIRNVSINTHQVIRSDPGPTGRPIPSLIDMVSYYKLQPGAIPNVAGAPSKKPTPVHLEKRVKKVKEKLALNVRTESSASSSTSTTSFSVFLEISPGMIITPQFLKSLQFKKTPGAWFYNNPSGRPVYSKDYMLAASLIPVSLSFPNVNDYVHRNLLLKKTRNIADEFQRMKAVWQKVSWKFSPFNPRMPIQFDRNLSNNNLAKTGKVKQTNNSKQQSKKKSKSTGDSLVLPEKKDGSTQTTGKAVEPTDPEDYCCPICFEPFTNCGEHRLVSLKCGHYFGKNCIERRWSRRGQCFCPQCLAKVEKADLRYHYCREMKVLNTSVEHALKKELLLERSNKQKLKTAHKKELKQEWDHKRKLKAELDTLRQNLNSLVAQFDKINISH